MDEAIEAAQSVRTGYEAVWRELHDQPELIPGDRQAIRARLRGLNDLGFSVDLEVDPVGPHGAVRLKTSVTTRRYHASELERRTRIRALEGQARILLHDLAEYQAWLEFNERRSVPAEEAADRWLRGVYRPTQARIAGAVGRERDLVQAYCDVLEHKWLLSEQAGRDVGLDAAIESYLAEGAPAPERRDGDAAEAADPALDASTSWSTTSPPSRTEVSPPRPDRPPPFRAGARPASASGSHPAPRRGS